MEPLLLIASPQMNDLLFEETVVLIWHHDADGALGVVINRPTTHRLAEVLDIDSASLDLESYESGSVGWGGPIEHEHGTVVTCGEIEASEGWHLPAGIGVTRSHDALVRLLSNRSPILLCLGYAGWAPGQLDSELRDGAWLWTDCNAQLLFDTPAAQRYDRALATIGLTRHTVWMQPGNA